VFRVVDGQIIGKMGAVKDFGISWANIDEKSDGVECFGS
jgi:hypothetical protein